MKLAIVNTLNSITYILNYSMGRISLLLTLLLFLTVLMIIRGLTLSRPESSSGNE